MDEDDMDICPEVRDTESGVWEKAFSLSASMHDKYDQYCSNCVGTPMEFEDWHEMITNQD